MTSGHQYPTLVFTTAFFESFTRSGFSATDQRRFVRVLELLDANEQFPSLRVHQLHGVEAGLWSASTSGSLRITFKRLADGRKELIECSRHYQR